MAFSHTILQMKFAFIIFKYFPYGGVQRDMLRIATDCQSFGHQVTIYTSDWQGPLPENLNVVICKAHGLTNHAKYQKLIKSIQTKIQHESFDLVVGFNRMVGLDVYFAADSCFLERANTDRAWWYRYTPRFKWFYQAENSIFRADGKCHILTLTEAEKFKFQKWYQTPESRFHLIPPFISEQRFSAVSQLSPSQRKKIRQEMRTCFGFDQDEKIMLLVGSGFKTKGADRAVLAFKSLPFEIQSKSRLVIIGQDAANDLKKLITDLNLEGRVSVLPGRDDIPQLMAASDLLIHPARYELAGHVLLEAMASGLPVITTDRCGYAPYIKQAGGGVVLNSPFDQQSLNNALLDSLEHKKAKLYRLAGLKFANTLMGSQLKFAEVKMLVEIAKARHS